MANDPTREDPPFEKTPERAPADDFQDVPGAPCPPPAPGEAPCDEAEAMVPMDARLAGEPSAVRRCLRVLGPGVISGASNNDPSAIATYAAAGAGLGLATLWAVPVLLPMMACVTYLSAKLGMVGGRGLAGILREFYPRWLLYPVIVGVFAANTFTAGADVGAIAAGIGLLVPVPPKVAAVVVGLGLLAVQVFAPYRLIAQTFKWLTLALFAFVVAGVMSRPDWGDVLWHTVVPTVRGDAQYVATLVAFVGCALSPYLFIWQSTQRVEEEVCMGRRRLYQRQGATEGELRYASWDVNAGMTVAAVMIYFIVLSTAATLHRSGVHTVNSAAEAAVALEPVAGRLAKGLFAVGFVGAGLLAVPVLTTGAAYAIAEGMGWKYGLDRRPGQAKGFYGVMAISSLIGLGINFAGVNAMTLLFTAAVVNGVLAAPLLVVVMLATNRAAIVDHRRNRPVINVVGWATTAAVIAGAVTLLVTSLR